MIEGYVGKIRQSLSTLDLQQDDQRCNTLCGSPSTLNDGSINSSNIHPCGGLHLSSVYELNV